MSLHSIDEHLIGITELDRQHARIFELVLRLQDAVHSGYGYAAGTILTELEVLTHIHFSVEESLMEIVEFADREGHTDQHVQLSRKLVHLRHRAQDLALPDDVADYLRGWLNDHVATFDRQLAEHLRKHFHGRAAPA